MDGPEGDDYFIIDNMRNFVELGEEFYACATFELQIAGARYNIEITEGCMFIKPLLHHWGSNTHFVVQFIVKSFRFSP